MRAGAGPVAGAGAALAAVPVAARGVTCAAVLAMTCAAALAGCAAGPPRPVAIDTANDQCASCRMIISDPRFGAEIAAPGREPLLFDDLRCLRDHLKRAGALPRGAAIFVADHRTGAFVPASQAVYLSVPALETPMASHVVAYADEASRRADAYAAAGAVVPASAILGPEGAP